MAEQSFRREQRAYSARFSPFISRCCQSMLTFTLSIPCARNVWITCSVMPTFRMKIFIAGSEFLCSRKTLDAVLAAALGRLPDTVDETRPDSRRTRVWKG